MKKQIEGKDFLICPHCGKKLTNLDDNDWGHSAEDTCDAQCYECDEMIVLTRSIMYGVLPPKNNGRKK